MILRPFFSFYGSKWRLAAKYPPPEYDTIIEPFAGSAGYSLRYPEKRVTLIERDPVIAGLWKWLIQVAAPEDILSLPRLERGDHVNDYDIPQEAKWLMGLWVSQCGAVPRNKVTPFGARRQRHTRTAGQLKYIRHWRIIEGDYTEAPDVEATWFIDPPYQEAGRHQYTFNRNHIDYPRLGEWCRSRQGQVIACENAGATWLPFVPFARQQGFTDRGRVNYSDEVVYLNYSQPEEIAA